MTILVDSHRCSLPSPGKLVSTHQILVKLSQVSVNFSQAWSILVSATQVIQDKNARISYRREGGAKQHPSIGAGQMGSYTNGVGRI